MSNYSEYIEILVRKDLAAFADPSEPVELVASKAGMRARWVQSNRERVATFTRAHDNFPVVEVDGRTLGYRAFLASEYMADLRQLATMITKLGYGVKDFVEARASHDAGDGAENGGASSAVELIGRLATESLPWGATKVVFVKGPAGCGKTYILRKLAEDQAQQYLIGKADHLFLYVDAQGKALARFDEAIAKELQDLRATFTYHAVAPLSRRGCVVVIVDGFDELLGSGGYDEAFASMSSFLGQLDGEGSLIASARSTFYDYKGFRRSTQRFDTDGATNYVVEPVEVHLWDKDQVVTYFRQLSHRFPGKFDDPDEVYSRLTGDQRVGASSDGRTSLERNQELLRKPFYVAKIAELHAQGERIGLEKDLLPQVVDKFVDREVGKIKDAQGQPILTKQAHLRFLTDLAEEMWWQETRQVDIPTVQTLAELLGEDLKLSPAQVRVIEEKAPSNAFLANRGSTARLLLGFEHEVFYSFFLSCKLTDVLKKGGDQLREFLSRATLPESVLEEALAASTIPADQVAAIVEHLGGALLQRTTEAVARENAGKLVRALVEGRTDLPAGLCFRHLVIRQGRLKGSRLEAPRFEGCYFEEVDLRDCVWTNPQFPNTTLHYPIVDANSTRLEGAAFRLGDQLLGLLVGAGGNPERVGDPEQVARVLGRIGAKAEGFDRAPQELHSATYKRRVRLLDRFLRYAQRVYYISEVEPRLRHIFGDSEWRRVKELLYEHGLAESVVTPKSGPRQDLMRLRYPPDLIRDGENGAPSSPEDVLSFWGALRAE